MNERSKLLSKFRTDLVKNPTALNNDEASEISKLNNMNDAFLNPGVTSESRK